MKKLISTIMALAIACTSFAAMNAGALTEATECTCNFDMISDADELEGYELVYRKNVEPTFGSGVDSYAVYSKKFTDDNGETDFDFKAVVHRRPLFHFVTYKEFKDYDESKEKIPDERIAAILDSYGMKTRINYIWCGAFEYEAIAPDDFPYAEEVYNKISEIVTLQEFSVGSTGFYPREFIGFEHFEKEFCNGNYGKYGKSEYGLYKCCNDYNEYSPTYYHHISAEEAESLAEYVKEKNLDFTVNTFYNRYNGDPAYDYACFLVPNYDIDFESHVEISIDIAKTLGIDMPINFFGFWFPECDDSGILVDDYHVFLDKEAGHENIKKIVNDFVISRPLLYENGKLVYDENGEPVVDYSAPYTIKDYRYGDANEDGEMNIADATAIAQAIGNKDKYGLTAQGEFNADLDGNGLTGADAVAIQQKLIEAGMPE